MTLPDPNTDQAREFDTGLCSTCGEPASFVDDRPGVNPVGYCANDLPDALRPLAAAGQLSVAEGAPESEEPLELTDEEETDEAVEKAADKVDRAARKR